MFLHGLSQNLKPLTHWLFIPRNVQIMMLADLITEFPGSLYEEIDF